MKELIFYVIIKTMKIRAFIAVAMLISLPVWGQKNDSVVVRDAKEYIETIEKVSKLKIDDQIDVWQTFLSDNPKQSFRKEIEKNIELLQSLSQKKPTSKQGDEKDAELYLKALEFSKKLSLNDQISLWEQFLTENPTSIYKVEAQSRLTRLKQYKTKKFPNTISTPISTSQPTKQNQAPTIQSKPNSTVPNTLSGRPKKFKDEDQAVLLAGLAGLIVPGMGHWYTEDYVIAGVLTAIRVAGVAIAVPGILNSNYNQIYVGGGMAVLTYAIDIADASYSAQRFNNKHSSAYLLPEENVGSTIPIFSYAFKF